MLHPYGVWPVPNSSAPDPSIVDRQYSIQFDSLDLAKAEVAYAAALDALEKDEPACVDEFFCAAQYAWHEIKFLTTERGPIPCRATEIYRSSLNGLISAGQKYKRFDPRTGLRVHTPNGWSTIPIVHHGFPRSPRDFSELIPIGEYSTKQLKNVYCKDGIGVPTVVIRRLESSEPFQRKEQSFAATLLLRIIASDTSLPNSSIALELYDPVRLSTAAVGAYDVPLATDRTAPIARVLNTTKRDYFQNFLQPGLVTPDAEGLFMLEPYQPGKIPIVLIHGLLSDRLTWANLANEFLARPECIERFQLWGFEYPTGESFLRSAALLRSQLEQISLQLDPDGTDYNLHQMVLVGHSMGGLVAKMQITESGTQLWSSISNRRFEDVAMIPATRKKLVDGIFFKPSPLVSRIVFIGTPHRGSALAQRTIGRIGSLLIEEPEDLKAEHDQLVRDNPDTFSREFTRHVPTSIDMLEPNSQLLKAVECLPVKPSVQMHSIIGKGRWMPGSGDSDSVVPVSSARHAGTESEKYVDEKHSALTEDLAVIDELFSILRNHYSEVTNQNPNHQ